MLFEDRSRYAPVTKVALVATTMTVSAMRMRSVIVTGITAGIGSDAGRLLSPLELARAGADAASLTGEATLSSS